MQEKEVNVKPFLMRGALVCGSAEPSVISVLLRPLPGTEQTTDSAFRQDF